MPWKHRTRNYSGRRISLLGVGGASQGVPLTPAQSINQALTAYWTMDEASGATREDSVGTMDLTSSTAPPAAAGKINNAANFVETNTDYLSHADDATLQTGNISWTMAGWVKPVAGLLCQIVAKSDSGTGEFHFDWDNTEVFHLVVRAGVPIVGAVDSTTLGTFAAGTYYFVAFGHETFGPGTIDGRVFVHVNGATVYAARTGVPTVAARPLVFASYGDLLGIVSFGDFDIDEWGFWKRKLTDAELAYLRNGGSGRTYPL